MTIVRENEATEAAEREVMTRLERAWGCSLHKFAGRWTPIDCYAVNQDTMVALVEIKSRPAYRDMVFLNVRKWTALSMAELGLGVPAYFAYLMGGLGGQLFYIPIKRIDPRRVRMGGTNIVTRSTDWEPCIEVFTQEMTEVPHAQPEY